jgi:hypothetical protein
MLYRHRLVSASFILNAEVIEVWWQLADAADALDFFFTSHSNCPLCLKMAMCAEKYFHIL